MKKLLAHPRSILLALLFLAALGLSGCTTTENEYDNASVRPWNSPRGWENGLGSLGESH
jgi:hypothetical protein